MKQDVFLAGLLGRVVELEAKEIIEERKTEKLSNKKLERKSIDRIKKFFHIDNN